MQKATFGLAVLLAISSEGHAMAGTSSATVWVDKSGGLLKNLISLTSSSAASNSTSAVSGSTGGGSSSTVLNSNGTITVKVSTSADLMKALQTAKAGETIALAPGTYSGLSMNNLNFSNAVTITSQSTANQAVLTSFNMSGSNGIKLQNLEMSTAGTKGTIAFRFDSSKNIALDGINMHGSLDDNPNNDFSGIRISNSSNITVKNSQFSQLGDGLNQVNNTNLTISGNSFHDINNDAIDGGGSSYVTISGNAFTNIAPKGDLMHPDAIQFWTTNTTASQHDISITNNVITRGTTPGTDVHGIFMGNENGIAYKNVTISGNIVTGLSFHGISVYKAEGLSITDNIVASDIQSWVMVQDSSNVVLKNNASAIYNTSTRNTAVSQVGNLVTKAIAPKAGTTLSSLLMSNSPLGASAISHTSSLTSALLQMSR